MGLPREHPRQVHLLIFGLSVHLGWEKTFYEHRGSSGFPPALGKLRDSPESPHLEVFLHPNGLGGRDVCFFFFQLLFLFGFFLLLFHLSESERYFVRTQRNGFLKSVHCLCNQMVSGDYIFSFPPDLFLVPKRAAVALAFIVKRSYHMCLTFHLPFLFLL